MNAEHDSTSTELNPNPWRSPPKGVIGSDQSNGVSIWIYYGFVGLTAVAAILALLAYRFNPLDRASASMLEQRAKQYTTQQLKDPASAQFRNIEINDLCVTGEINSKNSFGGYVGFKRFFYDDRKKVAAIEPEAQSVYLGDVSKLDAVLLAADYGAAEVRCSNPNIEREAQKMIQSSNR